MAARSHTLAHVLPPHVCARVCRDSQPGSTMLQMGAVLGVAAEADALADALGPNTLLADDSPSGVRGHLPGDTPDTTPRSEAAPTDVSDPSAEGGGERKPGAKFGKLGAGGKAGPGAAEARAKLASWSESGGVREGAFKKSRPVARPATAGVLGGE